MKTKGASAGLGFALILGAALTGMMGASAHAAPLPIPGSTGDDVQGLSEDSAAIIAGVEEALGGIRRYHIRMELDNESGYVSDREVDVEKEATHSIIRIGLDAGREVEFYWIGEEAYGLPRHVGTWFQVWVPGRPVSHLGGVFAILKTGEVTSVREEDLADERCWLLSVTPDLSALRSNPEEFVAYLLPSPEGSERDDELLAGLEEAMREAEMQAEFWISQETHYIKKATVTTSISDAEPQMTYHISNINDPGLEVSLPAEALEAEGPPMPLGALFIQLPDLGGWSEYNHCKITAEALKLIKKEDTDGQYPDDIYSEIYELQGKSIQPPYYSKTSAKQGAVPLEVDAPVVQGAWAEDAGDTERIEFVTKSAVSDITVRTFRDNHHFGGEDKGLKWQGYFELRSTDKAKVEKPKNGVRYISAKNWGFAGQDGDKMNFQGAIEAYNHYTDVGRKEAYYRMGHVLHLLQDQAEPDHAMLADHAGSSMNEAEAYEEFKVCLVKMTHAIEIGTAACAIGCAPAAAIIGIGYAACFAPCEAAALYAAKWVWVGCLASIRSYEVGFEYLIREYWDFNRPNVGKKYKMFVQTEASYDDYFRNVANDSIAAVYSILPAKDQKFPLGLGSLLISWIGSAVAAGKGASVSVYETVPGLDPDIELGKDDGPFLELADAVIVMATNRSAGLLQHFYEIVNYPPYVESVTVAQGASGLSPANVLAKPQSFIYSAKWKDEYVTSKLGNKISGRKLLVTQGEPVSKVQLLNAQRVYVLAEVRGKMKQLALELGDCWGASPAKHVMQDVTAQLGPYVGTEDRTCYFAELATPAVVSQISADCDALALAFTGEDAEAHFTGRTYSGKALDGAPATVALAGNVSPYYWTGYESGSDETHRIAVISSDKHEVNNDLNSATPIVYPSSWSPLLTYPFYDVTLHDSGDIDFFVLQLPKKGANTSKCEQTDPQKLAPNEWKLDARLTISVAAADCRHDPYLSGSSPTMTLYKKDGTPFTASEIPVIPSSDGAVASFDSQEIETYLHDGAGNYSVTFSIKAASGKKICYELGIQHQWCDLMKEAPELLYWKPEWEITGVLEGWLWWWPPYGPDPGDFPGPEPPEPPGPFPYPCTPRNIELVSEGGIPEPECFILRWPFTDKFQIDIGIRTPTLSGDLDFLLLDSNGEVLAEAEESNLQLLSVLSERSCDVCVTQSRDTSLPQSEYPRWKRITVDSLEAGTYLLEVTGPDIPLPAFYSFHMPSAMVVDDFERYTDDLGSRIFETWLDGRGYVEPAPGFPGNGTGSAVGHARAPFAEQTIVHGGAQSMPLAYDNTGAADKARYSETHREWASPQDWTKGDAAVLTLWLHGDPTNAAEQLYVAVEDSSGFVGVVYHPEPAALQRETWQEWNIDLREFSDGGVDLTSVKRMYIGVDNSVSLEVGGAGTIYIDDIGLHPAGYTHSLLGPDDELK